MTWLKCLCQHYSSEQYQPASETPFREMSFEWRLPGGPMVARFIACNSIESPYYKNGSFESIHLVFFEKKA